MFETIIFSWFGSFGQEITISVNSLQLFKRSDIKMLLVALGNYHFDFIE